MLVKTTEIIKSVRIYIIYTCLIFVSPFIYGQKVGLVLSGGGASGLAHVGVLKALEENNIPIDYITGTSIGALVGGLYASGLSPDEIETIVISEEFNHYVNGIIEQKYNYYFKQKEPNTSWITLKFSHNSFTQNGLPSSLISTIPIDLAIMEMFSGPGAVANYNFDSLFVPFRCVASDIVDKKQVEFSKGNLNEAIRASMSYPFYLKPLNINGKILFDGGLYNNFPSDIMYNDFFPDLIIGSNVSGNFPLPDEDDIISQAKSMVASITNYSTLCDNGVMIEAHSNISPFDFENPQMIIKNGYNSALNKIEEIKLFLNRSSDNQSLKIKRGKFREQIPTLNFGDIIIDGLNKNQSSYIKKLLVKKEKEVHFNKLKPEYYRLVADDKIKTIFPLAIYDSLNRNYNLILKIKKEREIITQFGGNISNKPVNQGFLGVQYNYLGKTAVTYTGNTYFGKLYGSVQLKIRVDYPNKIPFFTEGGYTLNRWDFFKSSTAFFEDVKPSYLIQTENYAHLHLGIPISNSGKLIFGGSYGNIENEYYQTRSFSIADTSDNTSFDFITYNGLYESSTLNRKQYANSGNLFSIKARQIKGEEFTKPGSTSVNQLPFRGIHKWEQIQIISEFYFKPTKLYRPGLYLEGVFSNQPLFSNYTSVKLLSPAFNPIPEAKTLFLENFRSSKYIAGGLRNVFSFPRNIDFRIEAYIFQPFKEIVKNEDKTYNYAEKAFDNRYYIASSSLIFHSPVGPLAANLNYYKGSDQPFSFMIHFGYILFNKSALE